jgi:hypothetical protein
VSRKNVEMGVPVHQKPIPKLASRDQIRSMDGVVRNAQLEHIVLDTWNISILGGG